MRPEAPAPVPAAAGSTYFGPGPEPVRPPERSARLGAPAAAVAGAVLLALAAVLARRPRRGARGRGQDPYAAQ